MQQMFRQIAMFIFLAVCSAQDMKRKKISVRVVIFFLVLGIGVDLWQQVCWQDYLTGVFLAVALLLLSRISQEQIGFGDGLVMLALSFFLTGSELIQIFFAALFAAACLSGVLLVLKRVGRRSSLPFLPFLLAAAIFRQMMC